MAANENHNPQQQGEAPVFDLKKHRETEKLHREFSRQVQVSATNPLLDCVSIVASTRKQSEKVTEQARKAIMQHYQDPFKLVNFIQDKGTPVYVMPAGLKSLIFRICLFFMGIDFGYVAPPEADDDFGQMRYKMMQKLLSEGYGDKAGMSFAKGVFVLPTKLFTVGFIAHQVHHWLACMAGLPGYSEEAQKEYKKFIHHHGGVVGPEHDKMSEEEIVNLRSAIHREIEALKFLKNVTEELFRPMRQARNIQGGTAHA